ncbi:hypothetical protein GCM10027610_078010 [Dactylosporangium cerinum]
MPGAAEAVNRTEVTVAAPVSSTRTCTVPTGSGRTSPAVCHSVHRSPARPRTSTSTPAGEPATCAVT